MMRLVAALLLTCTAALASTGEHHMQTAPAHYALQYKVTRYDVNDPKNKQSGLLTVEEDGVGLMLSYDDGKFPCSLVVNAHDSLATYMSNHQGYYDDYQTYSLAPIDIYFPFNYHCLQVFYPPPTGAETSPAFVDGSVRVNVFRENAPTRRFRPAASLIYRKGHMAELVFGDARYPIESLEYSNYRRLGSWNLPASIKVIHNRQSRSEDGIVTSHPVSIDELTLVSANPKGPPPGLLDIDRQAKIAFLYSYDGPRGQNTTEYNPSAPPGENDRGLDFQGIGSFRKAIYKSVDDHQKRLNAGFIFDKPTPPKRPGLVRWVVWAIGATLLAVLYAVVARRLRGDRS